MSSEKNLERKLRRIARKHDFFIRKSRVQNPSPNNEGGYMIVDLYRNYAVAGERYDLDLDDVAEFLTS